MTDALDILVVSQFFSPEMGAPAARFHDFGRLLVERGHRVRIITGFPNSPSGIVADGYRNRLVQREWIDGIEVLRGWLYASPRLTGVTKSLGFGTFALSASMRAVLDRPKADVVIATSPPLPWGFPACSQHDFLERLSSSTSATSGPKPSLPRDASRVAS